MVALSVVVVSVLIQITAGAFAVRMIRETGSWTAWGLIAGGLWGMALRRAFSLQQVLFGGAASEPGLAFELVGLAISVLMLAGVRAIKPVFLSIREAKETAETLSAEKERVLAELKKALSEVKVLKGFLPICAECKRIRDDDGQWHYVESYIEEHSDAEFTHGLCPDCGKRLYPKYHREAGQPKKAD